MANRRHKRDGLAALWWIYRVAVMLGRSPSLRQRSTLDKTHQLCDTEWTVSLGHFFVLLLLTLGLNTVPHIV